MENDIHTAPSKTAEERRKMMDLLKRFEEDAGNEEALLMRDESGDDEDEDDLASQFESMDIGPSSSLFICRYILIMILQTQLHMRNSGRP